MGLPLRESVNILCNVVRYFMAIHLDGEERAGCFDSFLFLVFRDCCVALPRGAMGLFAYFLIILTYYF